MSLLDCLRPASAPEPSDARVVRLLGPDDTNSAAKLQANRRYYERNRVRLAARELQRYRAKKP